MSGGMKQRVVGAIAMSGHPEVLIADEPTTALDVTIQLQYLKLLKRLQRETGMAILFITHDFGVVARMCDRVAVMYAGRIVECGPVAEVFDNPSHPYTQALIASVPKMTGGAKRLLHDRGAAAVADEPAGRLPLRGALPLCRAALRGSLPGLVFGRRRAYGRLLEARRRMSEVAFNGGPRGASAEPLLRVERLRKYYPFTKGILFAKTLGNVKAVDDVSFTLNAGETLGLVGELGCGKTTTSKLILNLEEPTDGRILLDGEPIHGLSGDALRRYRARVQAVFQDPWSSLNPRMTVGRTIAESLIVTRLGRPREDRRARRRAAAPGRVAARAGVAISARIQRRAASAHRARGGAGLASRS